jgi:histidinol-phosphatase
MRRGRLVLGVSSACAYGELAWAEEGGGAWLDGDPIRVSATAELRDTILSTGNLKTLAASPQWARYGQLVGRVNRLRGYGDFVHYHLLGRGALDAVVESDVNILDIAALSVIVTEAGGRFTDLSGQPVGLATTTVLATNGPLHDEIGRAIDFNYRA